MQTNDALDKMIDVLPEVAAIMNDKEAEPLFKRLRSSDADNLEVGDIMHEIIPLFARKYRQNIYALVAAYQGCTAEEVGEQDITITLFSCTAMLKMTSGFFACCLHMARNM
jgi:hypothetical protein